MIKDITIGQYYRANSPIHALDPRVKIGGTFLFILSLFLKKSLLVYAIATLFLFSVIQISKVPLRFILRGLKSIFFILFFSIVTNMLLTPGEVLLQFGIFRLTREGVEMAAFLGLRLVYLIVGSSLLTLTTTPNQLTDGLEKMFGFLNKIKVPVHDIAMMMSIALRFIPILTEELDKIMKAQMARGADFDEGNLFQKMRNMIPLLVPLFVAAIRRAGDLAMAMEARCYNGSEGRTKMKPLHYQKRDKVAYLILLLYMAVMLGAAFLPKLLFSVMLGAAPSASVAIIGGADGPTSIFLAGKINDTALWLSLVVLLVVLLLIIGIFLAKRKKKKTK